MGPGDFHAIVAKADALNELGRWDDALRVVTPVLTAEPEHLGAGVTAGVCLLNTGRAMEAREVLQRVALAHPRASDPLRLLSYAAVQLRESGTAVECARQAVELSPWSVDTHIQLSVALTSARDRPAAVAAARRAVEIAPASAAAHLALADALFPEGAKPSEAELAEAEHHVREALVLAPGNAIAHNELGRIAMARGQHFAAASALTSAVVSDPRQQVALANISMVFGQLVFRAHYVVFVLWLVSRFTVTSTTVERSALWVLEAVGLAVLAWTVLRLRTAARRRTRGLLRDFARRDPLGAAWGGSLAVGGSAFLLMGITPDPVTRALVPFVGACLVVGMVLSWIRVRWFAKRRQR